MKLTNKPLYLLGASAGGSLIQRLASSGKLRADGIIAEVSTTAMPSAKSPQTVWVVMSSEKEQKAAKEKLAALKEFKKTS